MFNINYSREAELDLDNSISYIAKESVTNALNYLKRYEKKIELLRQNPFIGVECKNKLIKRDCRVLVHESHIIIYDLDEENKDIFIIRIYHSSTDYPHKLNDSQI